MILKSFPRQQRGKTDLDSLKIDCRVSLYSTVLLHHESRRGLSLSGGGGRGEAGGGVGRGEVESPLLVEPETVTSSSLPSSSSSDLAYVFTNW